MPVGKSTGQRQSALASITIDGGPLRENWYGPHRAIGAFGTRIPLCIGPVDYVTRYPEAVPLRSISVKSVAEALFRLISRVGIPKEILTDQGTAFMSRTLKELYELLGIKSIRTSVYHPQTDGLVERFNRTLKTMVRKFVKEDAKNWDKWLEPLLFAVREVPQASTGFSPFELLYGRQPRGVLDVIKESWEEGPSNSRNEIQYVLDLRAKLHTLGRLSMENLLQAQDKQCGCTTGVRGCVNSRWEIRYLFTSNV